MKKNILAGISLLCAFCAFSQTSSYTFIREGGQMSFIDTAATGVIRHTVADDVVLPAKVALGFPFRFNGAMYDSIGISENGFIWFGPAQAEELEGIINPITEQLPASVKGVLCAFGIDLHPHLNTSLTTTIRSQQVEFAGRINDFIVEWRNTSRFDALNDTAGEDTLHVQIQLFPYENDRVQITYWNLGLNPNVTNHLSVGMKGESQGDFALRMTDAVHTWDSTAKGTSLQSTCELSITSNPNVLHNYMSWINDGSVGLNERVKLPGVSVFPVPAQDVLNIRTPGSYVANQYAISDVTGKVVKRGTMEGNQVSLADLLPGMYFLKLEGPGGLISDRFVKQ